MRIIFQRIEFLIIIVLLTNSQGFGQGNEDSFNFKVDNVTLDSALNKLGQQFNVNIIKGSSTVDKHLTVSVDVSRGTILKHIVLILLQEQYGPNVNDSISIIESDGLIWLKKLKNKDIPQPNFENDTVRIIDTVTIKVIEKVYDTIRIQQMLSPSERGSNAHFFIGVYYKMNYKFKTKWFTYGLFRSFNYETETLFGKRNIYNLNKAMVWNEYGIDYGIEFPKCIVSSGFGISFCKDILIANIDYIKFSDEKSYKIKKTQQVTLNNVVYEKTYDETVDDSLIKSDTNRLDIRYLRIPFTVEYKFRITDNFWISAGGGMSTNFLIDNKQIPMGYDVIYKSDFLYSVYNNLILNIGFGYSINNLSLYAKPNYEVKITYQNKGFEEDWNMSGKFGINYKF